MRTEEILGKFLDYYRDRKNTKGLQDLCYDFCTMSPQNEDELDKLIENQSGVTMWKEGRIALRQSYSDRSSSSRVYSADRSFIWCTVGFEGGYIGFDKEP